MSTDPPTGSNANRDEPGFAPREPVYRSLQIYGFDPSLELDPEIARVNRSTIQIDWEPGLEAGPVGEYVEVIDVDPASQCVYDPVNLNHPYVLERHGLPPSEGNPQFHQQMVYAVAMKTISNFERALGRTIQWSARQGVKSDEAYVPRLRIYPHAMREANAYYSPDKKSLLFGYFNALTSDSREGLPGGIVFSCLSHDVIAHETTHAILDGIHPGLLRVSNPDSLAFHEAFGDLVAIFQHFTLPRVLEHQIARTRGDLTTENLMAKLAGEFGRATKRGTALRDALGGPNSEGKWERARPDPQRISRIVEPHARGAILMTAIFDSFLTIYNAHTADLLRIATGGTGQLQPGELHPDLVGRLADEASRVAQRILMMCIRALDYLPPVDVTYGDYVRAFITADADLVPEDRRNYRIAFIRALRDWGIYPPNVRTLSVDSLRWCPLDDDDDQQLLSKVLPGVGLLRTIGNAHDYVSIDSLPDGDDQWLPDSLDEVARIIQQLMVGYQEVQSEQRQENKYAAQKSRNMFTRNGNRREKEFLRERQFARVLHWQMQLGARTIRKQQDQERLTSLLGVNLFDKELKLSVDAVRPVTRVHRDGRTKTELLLIITQRNVEPLGNVKLSGKDLKLSFEFRGGCTLLIDPDSGVVRYAIKKEIGSGSRKRRQEKFLRERLEAQGLAARALFGVTHESEDVLTNEPFYILHRGSEWDQW